MVPHSDNQEVLDEAIVGCSRSNSYPAKGEDVT